MGWFLYRFQKENIVDNKLMNAESSISLNENEDHVRTPQEEQTVSHTSDTNKWRFVCNTLSDSELIAQPSESDVFNRYVFETKSMVRLFKYSFQLYNLHIELMYIHTLLHTIYRN